MPDVWTKHPDIVRDLLKEAGFTCGVEGRFLKGRDPAWTCIYDGQTIRGDLYIHHVTELRSDLQLPTERVSPSAATLGDIGSDWSLAAFAILLGLAVARWWRRRTNRA